MRSIRGVLPCMQHLRERKKGGENIHKKEWVCSRSKERQAREQRRKTGRVGKEKLVMFTKGKESNQQHQILILNAGFSDLEFLQCSVEPCFSAMRNLKIILTIAGTQRWKEKSDLPEFHWKRDGLFLYLRKAEELHIAKGKIKEIILFFFFVQVYDFVNNRYLSVKLCL